MLDRIKKMNSWFSQRVQMFFTDEYAGFDRYFYLVK